MSSSRFSFRRDQCEFIIASMDYVIMRCDERINNGKYAAFDQFSSERTKERAAEIRDEIKDVIS